MFWCEMKMPACLTSLVLMEMGHANVILDPDLWPSPWWPWPLTSFSNSRLKNTLFMFDFDFWPTILTFNPILARVTINLHAKSPGHSLNSLAMRVHTDRQTNKHTHARPIILPLPLTREVKLGWLNWKIHMVDYIYILVCMGDLFVKGRVSWWLKRLNLIGSFIFWSVSLPVCLTLLVRDTYRS